MKTKAGTQLQIINLKGKDYMMVHQRLVWFREEHPTWSIETEFVSLSDKAAMAKAIIKDDAGKVIATAHKQENTAGFGDFMEKAETGAVGRALLLCGYGTAFAALDLDEGERIVDSPVETNLKENKEVKVISVQINLEKELNKKINDEIIKRNPDFKGLTYKEAAHKDPDQFGIWMNGILTRAKNQKDNEWKETNIKKAKAFLDYVVTINKDEIPF